METLIDKLLVEQSNLQTPVAQFSKIHNNHELRTDLYKHLIPLEKPAKGEQYTFQVELDKCTGCKACLVACHTLNGLDEDEAWRDVGLLEGGDGGDLVDDDSRAGRAAEGDGRLCEALTAIRQALRQQERWF